MRGVRGSGGAGSTSQGVVSLASAFTFSLRPSGSSSSTQMPQCQMSQEPRTAGKMHVVIADWGEVKVMFRADQGFCEVSLAWLVTKTSP